MEFLNWKNILLEWVNRLEFLGQPYYNLNQTEVETFFDSFKKNVSSIDISSVHLDEFVKVHYPTFDAICNEDKKFCQGDYVYVYSILLHFSCVKCPDKNIQNVCKSFQVETQQIIAEFLKTLIGQMSFDRESFKSAILSSVPAKISDYVLALSPTKSPGQLCPPTPKTKIMNEWNCENKQLKALVETERFEKGFLEVQLKKLEENINILNQERRKFMTEIQQLKTQLAVKDTENVPPNGVTNVDVLKRRLRKEIDEKDETIVKLQQTIDDLTDSNQRLAEKLSYVDAEYKKSVDTVNVLHTKLNVFSDEFEKSQQHIKGLELTIKEYQIYFNELRNPSSKSNSLDGSADNLDDSYTIAMASLSGKSQSSPENLSHVVDMQLREQIRINEELTARYDELQEDNAQLSKRIVSLIDEHSRKLSATENKCQELEEENKRNLKKFDDKLQEIAKLSQEFERNVKESHLLKTEFDLLMVKANESQQRIDNLNLEIHNFENQLTKLVDENSVLSVNNEKIIGENAEHIRQINILKEMQNELTVELDNSLAVVKELNVTIEQLQQKVIESADNELKSNNEIDQLKHLLNDSQKQIDGLAQKYEESMTEKSLALQQYESDKSELKIEVQRLKTSISQLSTCFSEVKADLATAEEMKSKLLTQNNELIVTNAKIEEEKDSINAEVSHLTTCIAEVKNTLTSLSNQNEELEIKKCSLEKEFAEKNAEVSRLNHSLVEANAAVATAEKWQLKLTAKIEELSLEKSETEKKNDEINAEVSRLNDRLSEANAAITNSEENQSQLTAKINELLLEKDELKKKNDEIVAEVSRLSISLTEVRTALAASEVLQDKLSNQNKAFLLQKCSMEKESVDIKAEVSRLNDCLNEANASITNFEENQSKLTAKIDELLLEKNKLKKMNDGFNEEVSTLNKCLIEAKANLTSFEELQSHQSTQNKDLMDRVTNQENQIQSLTATANENRIEQGNLNAIIADLKKQIESLQNENYSARLSFEDMFEKYRFSLFDCKKLQEELQPMKNACCELEILLNQSEEEKEKLFLNLQEKIDETEIIEANLNELNEKTQALEARNIELRAEKSELTAKNNELGESNEKLRREIEENDKNLIKVRSELQKMNENAKHEIYDMQQLQSANAQLRNDNISVEKELNLCRLQLSDMNAQLDMKSTLLESQLKEIKDFHNERSENEHKFRDLEVENHKLNNMVDDLKIERDELSIRFRDADDKLTSLQKVVNKKNDKISKLVAEISELTVRSEAILLQESMVDKSRTLVEQLSKELDESKTHLDEKEELVRTLSEELATLNNVEQSRVAEVNKMSSELKELRMELQSSESSKEKLSLECASLATELKDSQSKHNELQKCVDDATNLLESEEKRVVDLQLQLEEQRTQLSQVTDQQLLDLNVKLESSRVQLSSATREVENLRSQLAESVNLQEEIEKFRTQNQTLLDANKKLTSDVQQFKTNVESCQKSIDLLTDEHQKSCAEAVDYKTQIEILTKSKEELHVQVKELTINIDQMSKDLEIAKSENSNLKDENIDLATAIEKVRQDSAAIEQTKANELNALQNEIKQLIAENTTRNNQIEELRTVVDVKPKDLTIKEDPSKLEVDLKIALSDLESKILECQRYKDREKSLEKDLEIFTAKLIKHRELSTKREDEWNTERVSLMEVAENKIKENRLELEIKLDKMKEKMKYLYTDETSKAKERHERELNQIKKENRELVEKNDRYETHVRQISRQLYQLNERNLELQKENGIIKNKLRMCENNSGGRLFPATSIASNLKMEDEEGEFFNNTYLTDLKSGTGKISPTGRDSIRLSELHQRNLMAAPHLRSTYLAQYGDQNLKEEDLSMALFNESMASAQSDMRRGTLYQRPGPPTPSKNGGRLSVGANITASDLFPKDVLREQNNNTRTKNTPGKLMSIFSSSKPKVERTPVTRPIYSTYTSTPRRKSKIYADRHHFLQHMNETIEIDLDTCFSNVSYSNNDEATSVSLSICKFQESNRPIRRFSIISKHRSSCNSIQFKNRIEYRKKGHSKRVEGFLLGRSSALSQSYEDVDDEIIGQTLEPLCPDYTTSVIFENLAKKTISEHPYSNEVSTATSQSSYYNFMIPKTMFSGGAMIHGKIPKITINSVPERQLIQSKNSSDTARFTISDFIRLLPFVFVLGFFLAFFATLKFN